jgi:hypothetical protein
LIAFTSESKVQNSCKYSSSGILARQIMKHILLVIMLMAFPSLFYGQDQVAFYVQGHADDWQLFMSKNIVEDASFARIVIITVTAGDAGHGNTAYGNGKIPYFMAREKGAIYSSKFAFDMLGQEVSDIPLAKMTAVNGHSIAKYIYKDRVINYFLRLPDGFHGGEGVPTTGNQSLQKLKEGKLKTITAVDNSATYQGWSDLTQTIKSIIISEKGSDEQVWINIPSYDHKYNEGDHSDHYTTSLLVQDAVVDLPWTGLVSWMHYRTRKLPANLSSSELENSSALFAAYTWSITESGYITSFDKAHKQFLPGQYSIIIKRPSESSLSGKMERVIEYAKRKIGFK